MKKSNPLKFFIVDDDIFFATINTQCLNNLNFTDITYFNNGQDCLKHLNQNPDIVLLDYNMDDITGLEVLKNIKRTNSKINVIVISGQESENVMSDILAHGAYQYIQKDSLVCNKLMATLNKIT